MDPITQYILLQEKTLKKLISCTVKCDKITQIYKKRALGILATLPVAPVGVLSVQAFTKSGIVNNYCAARCFLSRAKQKKDSKNIRYYTQKVKTYEKKIEERLRKLKEKNNRKGYEFMKKIFDEVKRM